MSAARPTGTLFTRCLSAAAAATSTSSAATAAPARCSSGGPASSCVVRQFSSSARLHVRRRPRFSNVRASEMGLVSEEKVANFSAEKFPRYTKAELAELAKRYSPEQMKALEAGEAAIDPKDLTIQGRLRVDPYRMPYIDDFSDIQPIIDRRPKHRQPPPDPMARFMNVDEFTKDLIEWADKFETGDVTGTLKKLSDFVPDQFRDVPEGQWPGKVRDTAHKNFAAYLEAESQRSKEDVEKGGPTDADILEYILERSAMTDGNRPSNSALAPALPNKVPGVAGLYKNAIDAADEGLDDSGVYQDLKRRTGMSVREILDVSVKTLVVRRVVNQTRLGKVASNSVLTVAGNKNGWLGLGIAKSTEPALASQKSALLAIRNMRPIARYENRTIYGNVDAKIGGSIVQLFSRPPGFGLRVSHRIFEMCRAAGISDLAAKFPRSRNPLNTVKATYEALLNQKNPEEIAIGRGKKLVDVRKVYYGGSVY
ncbi:hypothetical protein QBC46DRAFT_33203 [Diplogelasinospora grovesii]|uniref:Small ribosomal subunit protein uS5m n=1 Tax=Diplogelasinospora grovesii TaxID=303347 RepID=A0AAN6NCV6_9PEZI|nr:hypothetical protein QBC46DRAFT_33203 [Diplogelasinospora grovesii]